MRGRVERHRRPLVSRHDIDPAAALESINLDQTLLFQPSHNGWRRAVRRCANQTHQIIILRRSEEHTSELQSLMRISYAVFCLKKKKKNKHINTTVLIKQQLQNKQHIKITNLT